MITREGAKTRAGFFDQNVFVEALTELRQLQHLLKVIPREVADELGEYLKEREEMLRDGRLSLEDEAVGKQLKPPIITVTDLRPAHQSEISDASAESKTTVRIHDVKEGKMQVAKQMPQLGKEFNPEMATKVHEGLKRVVIPSGS
jgi:spore cortex formation protein SpoVR/YcgB (stage V sporulation)